MKKLLLEFYKELLPVFEKYGAEIEVDHLQRRSDMIVRVNSPEYEGDKIYYGPNLDAVFLKERIEELENEKNTAL